MVNSSSFLGGWPLLFYISGLISIVLCIAWSVYIRDSPELHPGISDKEFQYILTNQKESGKVNASLLRTPWKGIFTSLPVWALATGMFCQIWNRNFLIADLPTYLQRVYSLNMLDDGIFSMLPFIFASFGMVGSGFLADFLIKKWFSVRFTRNVTVLTGFLAASMFYILISYSPRGNKTTSLIYICLLLTILMLSRVNVVANVIDITPQFSSVVFGLINTFGQIGGSIAILIAGYVTNHAPTVENYRKVFLMNCFVSLFSAIIFGVFSSGEVQDWNGTYTKLKEEEQQQEENEENVM